MGSALTDDPAVGTSNSPGRPLSPTPSQRASPPNATVVRLLDGEVRDSRRAALQRPRTGSSPLAPITVLTDDAELCDLIRAAVSPEHRVFRATMLEEAEEFAATDRCAILVTDQSVERSDVHRITDILRAHEPALITIAVGTREQDEMLVDLLSDGAIDRFMVRPLKPEPTRLVIDSAAREHHGLKAKVRRASVASVPLAPLTAERTAEYAASSSAQEQPSISRSGRPPDAQTPMPRSESSGVSPAPAVARAAWRSNETGVRADTSYPMEVPATAEPAGRRVPIVRSPWFGAVAGIIVTAAIAAVMGLGRSPRVDPEQIIAKHLTAAQAAYDQGRFVDPLETSALQSYRTVLALDPQNAQAKGGLERIANRLVADARTLIREQRLTQAVATLQAVRRVQPDHPELAALNAQLRQALQARLLEQSREQSANQPAPMPPVSAERRTVQAPAKSSAKSPPRLEASRSTPTSAGKESAKPAVLADTAGAAEAVRPGADTLVLLRQRIDENRLLIPTDDSALHYFNLLKQGGGASVELQQASAALGAKLAASAQIEIYRKDLDTAERLLAEAKQIAYAGDDLAAAQAALAAARSSVAPVSAAPTERKIANYVPPVYPPDALEREIEGWVDVRVQINPAGEVLEATAEGGQRREVFERAALLAARQWKYAPRPESTTPDTVRTRVRFRLKD
jgi:TonB family protein